MKIVKAACVLHNFLRTVEPNLYAPPGYTDTDNEQGDWRADFAGFASALPTNSRNSAVSATTMREQYATYFLSPQGQLDYQLAYVNRTA